MVRTTGADLLRILCLAAACATASAAQTSLGVDGTAFVLTTPQGEVLRGEALAGAIVHLALDGKSTIGVRLASIVRDPQDPEILQHEFQVQGKDGAWQSFCSPTASGETWGFPLALPDGHPGRDGAITISCASGAVGKCVRFGYRPWSKGPRGEDLAPYHAACVRMVRADYCGDGHARTKDGTLIDLYDDLGIQKDTEARNPAFGFEAGWAPHGATCVARTRWQDIITREALLARCPRLATAGHCDEAQARKLGARVFNRARVKQRLGD